MPLATTTTITRGWARQTGIRILLGLGASAASKGMLTRMRKKLGAFSCSSLRAPLGDFTKDFYAGFAIAGWAAVFDVAGGGAVGSVSDHLHRRATPLFILARLSTAPALPGFLHDTAKAAVVRNCGK